MVNANIVFNDILCSLQKVFAQIDSVVSTDAFTSMKNQRQLRLCIFTVYSISEWCLIIAKYTLFQVIWLVPKRQCVSALADLNHCSTLISECTLSALWSNYCWRTYFKTCFLFGSVLSLLSCFCPALIKSEKNCIYLKINRQPKHQLVHLFIDLFILMDIAKMKPTGDLMGESCRH